MSAVEKPEPMLRIAISLALSELVLSQAYDRDWHDLVSTATDQWFRTYTLPASIAQHLPYDLVAQVQVVDDGVSSPGPARPAARASVRTGAELLSTCFECGWPLRANLEYVNVFGKNRAFCGECAERTRDFLGIEKPEG